MFKMCPNMNKKVRSQDTQKSDTVELEELIVTTDTVSFDQNYSSVEIAVTPVEDVSNETSVGTPLLLENQEDENLTTRLYKCTKCGKSFAKKSYAKAHCKPKKPWRCPKCSENISHKKNIKRHLESCQKKFLVVPKVPSSSTTLTFICDVCSKSFLFKRNMLRHKEKKHSIVEVKVLECETSTCSFTTNSKDQMKRHMTVYHGTGRKWNCDQCDSKFFSQNGLKKHRLATHRLKCDECIDSFANDKDLRVHKVIYHAKTSQDVVANKEPTEVYVTRAIGEHSYVHIPVSSSD